MDGFRLPDAPESLRDKPVKAWSEPVVIPWYAPLPADKHPMFLEKRVYQGSSGKVYPLPFIDRISEQKTDRVWEALHIENEYVRLMILPELGGRIHVGLDKTNGYDFFYRQNVIKPALVGLAGPWISGGVEFNWPQHHRPSTFMRCDWEIENHDDGSVTIWCGEHEPMNRMKGMHGICLRPGSSLIELKVRLYNRTELPQTFLWWANVGVRVHEAYQSFFPPDVTYVADHAKRAMSRFPLCEGKYYGVDYAANATAASHSATWPDGTAKKFVPPEGMYAPNDLSWYANIPVPTSYMAMGSKENFFGGYDHKAQAGFVHVADHHIAPGKKQWTWGNHEFGYAWDKNLSDDAGPYIELMAGVFTDNQPDFSWLMPGETRSWSQYWYPIQKIGVAQQANEQAAISLRVIEAKTNRAPDGNPGLSGSPQKARCACIGVAVTSPLKQARLRLSHGNTLLHESVADLSPDTPLLQEIAITDIAEIDVRIALLKGEREIIAYQPQKPAPTHVPPPAKEPALPANVASIEELYLIGTHLDQYRHATRLPEDYWREALRREPINSRCNNALGLWHLRRGEFVKAVECFGTAIATLTRFNPNPREGEAYYNLGVTLRHLGQLKEAYEAFGKAQWNEAWKKASRFAMIELDCALGDFDVAAAKLHNLRKSGDVHDNQPFVLASLIQSNVRNNHSEPAIQSESAEHQEKLNEIKKKLGQISLNVSQRRDNLDFALRYLAGKGFTRDLQCCLDISLTFSRSGLHAHAITGIKEALLLRPALSNDPLLHYYLAFYSDKLGKSAAAEEARRAAALASPDYCFPSRLEELAILQDAIAKNPTDARAPYYLGNWMYDRRRREEAIALWEKSVKLDREFPIVWRNLGMAYFNVLKDILAARGAYDRALSLSLAPGGAIGPDGGVGAARVFYERDQMWKRLGETPKRRLEEVTTYLDLVPLRDDLTIEYCTLLNQLGRHEEALRVLEARRFQPWEGGEGLALSQWARTHIALGRNAFWQNNAPLARKHFEAALKGADNLGEAWHFLANKSEAWYWAGIACRAAGDHSAATRHLESAARATGDFRDMSVSAFSEITYFSALALTELGRLNDSRQLFEAMETFAKDLATKPAQIDYFATSLPAMLLFEDDLQKRQLAQAKLIEALAVWGLGEKKKSRQLLKDIVQEDPNHAVAADLLETIDWGM